MAVSSDAGLMPIYKEWYTTEKMEALLFRASPLLRAIVKNRVGGKSYNFAANYGAGGACAGDATVASTLAASAVSKNVQFSVTPGRLFSIFNVGAQEMLAAENIRGAFVPVPVVKMYTGTAAFRRLYATALYGMGFGEFGQVVNGATITQGASNTIDFAHASTVIKLDIGSVFIVTNGALPSSTLRTLECTVTAIDGTSVTFTAAAGSNETWANTDWIEIKGCRNSTTPLLPIGLAGWIPSLAGRTSATWTTYVGTSFFGVDRSVYPSRLAGSYVARNTGASEKYADCVVRAINECRQAGCGNNFWLVINPKDYNTIIGEVNGQTTYFQQTDMGKAKGKSNEVARGLSDAKFMFSSSYLDKIYDDPFCPRYTAYIIDSETIEFALLTNGDAPVKDGINGNDPGVQPVDGVTAPDLAKNAYQFIFDDYVTVQPGSLASDGPVSQVILQLFGSLALRAPGFNAVINFVS